MKSRDYRRYYIISLAVLLVISACLIVVFGISAAKTEDESDASGSKDDIQGCYAFDECLYMSPLSSFYPFGDMPYVYGVGRDALIIANTGTGDIWRYTARYEKTPVAEDELLTKIEFTPEAISHPDLSLYRERCLRAVFTDEERQYNLYQMDGEIWLADFHGDRIWSIYRLKKTDGTTFDDLERAYAAQNESKGLPQLTLKDVYALARLGDDLTLRDLDVFDGKAVGSGFMIMRYEIEGGCVLAVHCDTPESKPGYVRLSKRGYDPFDEALTVDIRLGTAAVAAYLDPLNSLTSLKIEDPHGGTLPGALRGDVDLSRELIYEFDGYRYYLKTTRADSVFITFANDERLPLKQALEEHRTIIEDAVANGLHNVFMEPSDNPLGGSFTILQHAHTFSFDNEAFYPSKSFMYIAVDDTDDIVKTYFDASELADILSLQGRDALADTLRRIIETNDLPVIAGKPYIIFDSLPEAGIAVDIGWALSSHTPVNFSSQTP